MINGSSTDAVCYNASNGTIEVLAPNTGDWIYNLYLNGELIESEQSSNDNFTFQNLSPGTYSATIIESTSDCVSEELIFELIAPEAINVETSINNATCDGGDGAIEIEIVGGTPLYSTILGNDELVLPVV